MYRQPVDAAEDAGEDLGTTPLESVRFARQTGYRLRFELTGHRRVELLQYAIRGYQSMGLELDRAAVMRLHTKVLAA